MSVSTLGPGRKEFMNHGDFQAEGDSILLLNGVPPNLKTPSAKQQVRNNHGQSSMISKKSAGDTKLKAQCHKKSGTRTFRLLVI